MPRCCTWNEAYEIGLARHWAALARGGVHRWGWRPDPATAARTAGMSAVAEWLVSVVTGTEWLSTGLVPDDPDDGDVAPDWAVRWTPYPTGRLIAHPSDRDHLKGVLVVGAAAPLVIVGWIPMTEAKDPGWWTTAHRAPAFFVPQAVVRQRALWPAGVRPIQGRFWP